MKAKVKTTGEIIDVSRTEDIITLRGVEKQYVDNKSEWRTYVQSELDFIKEEPQRDIDWEQRRFELIKSAIQGFCANSEPSIVQGTTFQQLAERSIEMADIIIVELRKGGQNGQTTE